MSKSILNSIKKLLNRDETDTDFDTDIIIHINSTLAVLNQLGVGPTEAFAITGSTETWDTFLGEGNAYNFIESYIYMKVKLIFDPPSNTAIIKAYQDSINEFEYRATILEKDGGSSV